MLTVSVVVPVLNAARTLPACLGALGALDPAPGEILVVDNGSSDRSVALLEDFARELPAGTARRLLHEATRGAAAARNAAIRAARGEVIAFTDADCAPEADWLRPLSAPFGDPAVGAVAGRVVAAPARSTLELFSALYTLQSADRADRRRGWTPWEGGYPTANFAVRTALARDLGGFDERLEISGEDYDLCARLYARGAEIVYTPDARVAHHHRTTLRAMLRQAFGFGRSHPYMLRRHGPPGLWLDLPGRPLHCPGAPGRAWIDLASADKKLLGLLLLGAAWPPALWLLPLYAAWLVAAGRRRARAAGLPVSAAAAAALAGLLVAKSAAMTAGRWRGSVKYGAVCL